MCIIPSDDNVSLKFVLFQIRQVLFFFQYIAGYGAASEKAGNASHSTQQALDSWQF